MDSLLERTILSLLEYGSVEPYELPPASMAAVGRVLERVLRGPSAEAELTRTLQLVVAFEKTLGAPTVADRLATIIRADPDALALIEARIRKHGAIDELRRFRAREGRDSPVLAPVHRREVSRPALRPAELWDRVGGLEAKLTERRARVLVGGAR